MIRKFAIHFLILIFLSGCFLSTSSAIAAPTKQSSSQSHKTKKKTSKKSKTKKSSKKSKSTRSTIDRDRSPETVQFSDEEIQQYKDMPFGTWNSPTEVSEIGLPIEPGFAQPYPYGNLLRQYDGGNCRHRGIDIGSYGEENNGIGGIVNAVTKSEITFIGKTGEDVGEFGKLDKRSGEVTRTGRKYPRQVLVPGYGLVYTFSTNYGRWRSGTVVVTRVLEGPLKDHIIRYMHLATVRPDLKVGSVVEAGEHLALMGGTAVLDSFPHVHMDLETPDKQRKDLGPYIGLPETASHCKGRQSSKSKKNTKKSSSSSKKSSSSHNKRSSYVHKTSSAPKPQTRTLNRK